MTMAKKVAKRKWVADPLAAIRLVSRVTPGGADSAARQTIIRTMYVYYTPTHWRYPKD